MSSPSFRTVRWLRTINLVLQAVLFVTFFGGLNYLAKHHALGRIDLTQQRKFSLSPETLSYLQTLDRPVHIVVARGEDADPQPEIKGLLQEFVHATAHRDVGKITVENIDIYQHRRRAETLGIDTGERIVLLSGDKRHVLRISELYDHKAGQREKFRGEQVITAAILDVASLGRKKIYFVVGHGEARPSDPHPQFGLSAAREELALRNFEIDEIDLSAAREVPADAHLLIAVAPGRESGRFQPREQELLRQYLSAHAGRMIFFLAPGAPAAVLGIDDLLLDWGVLVHDDIIWDTQSGHVAENGDLLLYAFSRHPITNTLIDQGYHLRLGASRTVMPDPGRTVGGGLNTVALAATSTTAWGERDWRRKNFKPDDSDTRPRPFLEPPDRLPVIVASERVALRDNLPFSVKGGKLVVFGTGDMISNARLNDAGNRAAFLNAVNWTVDRDLMLNIPPRPVERFSLSLSAADFSQLRYLLLLVLPGASLLLGLLVYWTRRA